MAFHYEFEFIHPFAGGNGRMGRLQQWISRDDTLPLSRQCDLAGVARSTVYVSDLATLPTKLELILLAELDAEYTRHPFFGSRKMVIHLKELGHIINRKRINLVIEKSGRNSQPTPFWN